MKILKKSCCNKISASLIFALVSWFLLYLWLILVHSIEERVASTILSSPLVHTCIALAMLLLMIQKKPGALKELAIIAFWIFVIFIYTVFIFNIVLSNIPNINDFVFYSECFLLIVFCGSPLYLSMRMI